MGVETTRKLGATMAGIALVLLSTACYEHTVTVGAGAPQGPVVYDHWENFWIAGLSGHTRVDVEELCQSGDATVYMRQTFLNGLVSGLTSGIYTPMTVTVRCADGSRSEVRLNAEDMAGLATDPNLLKWVDEMLPERLGEAAPDPR